MLPESSKLQLVRSENSALDFNALDLPEADIQSRFAWAVRQGRPSYLWPELPVHVWRACLSEIERAAAHIVAGDRKVTLRLPSSASARSMGIGAFTSGMGPYLGYWLEHGMLETDAETGRLLALHLVHARAYSTRLQRGLDDVLEVLFAEEIPVTVIKGASTARKYFPEPALRPAADIDLVLTPADIRCAADCLQRAGYRPIGQPYAAKSEWVPPGTVQNPRSLELLHGESGYTLDVHASLDRNFDGIETARLGETEALSVAWPELAPNARRLGTVANAALLALHTSHEWHRLQLIRVIELTLVLRQDFPPGSANWGSLIALLELSGTQRFVYPAFELVERFAPGTVDAALRLRLQSNAHPRLVRVMSSLRPGEQRFERQTLDENLVWAANPWQVLRRLVDFALPFRSRRADRPIHAIYRERLYRLLRGRSRSA